MNCDSFHNPISDNTQHAVLPQQSLTSLLDQLHVRPGILLRMLTIVADQLSQ
jgi:hypothetical protein